METGDRLMLNFLTLGERLVYNGGWTLLEHPEDPGVDPFPSIFSTEVFLEWLRRTGAAMVSLDQ